MNSLRPLALRRGLSPVLPFSYGILVPYPDYITYFYLCQYIFYIYFTFLCNFSVTWFAYHLMSFISSSVSMKLKASVGGSIVRLAGMPTMVLPMMLP